MANIVDFRKLALEKRVMTYAVIELGLGLYLILGVGLAEWGLRQSIVRQRLHSLGPRKGYLFIVAFSPFIVLALGTTMMVCTIGRQFLQKSIVFSGVPVHLLIFWILVAGVLIFNLALL